jgi:anti-sigma factor RsiW
MNCDLSEKVSMLIDGELPASEADQMTKHIIDCAICRQVERDFRGLRHQIKSDEFEPDPIAQRQMLWKVLASQESLLWRRTIALPAPVFALIVVALLALIVWSVISDRLARETDHRVSKAPVLSPSKSETGSIDLSRFDRGERAILYKEHRPETIDAGAKGATR